METRCSIFIMSYMQRNPTIQGSVYMREKHRVYLLYKTEAERAERFDDLMGAMQKQTLLPGPIEAVEALRGSMI